jgi:hypothetical protein
VTSFCTATWQITPSAMAGPSLVRHICMYSANGGHHGNGGDCTATGTGRLSAPVNTSSGNLAFAGIHCILSISHNESECTSRGNCVPHAATVYLTQNPITWKQSHDRSRDYYVVEGSGRCRPHFKLCSLFSTVSSGISLTLCPFP